MSISLLIRLFERGMAREVPEHAGANHRANGRPLAGQAGGVGGERPQGSRAGTLRYSRRPARHGLGVIGYGGKG